MDGFLKNWLLHNLDHLPDYSALKGQSVHIFARVLSNGIFIGEILFKHKIITAKQKESLFDSNKPGPRIQNLIKIHKWLVDNGFPVEIQQILEIIDGKPGSALKLLYRLYMWFESPSNKIVVTRKDYEHFGHNKKYIYKLQPPFMVDAKICSQSGRHFAPASQLYFGLDAFDCPLDLESLFANCHFRRYVCCVYKNMFIQIGRTHRPWNMQAEEESLNKFEEISEAFLQMQEYDDLVKGKNGIKAIALKRRIIQSVKDGRKVLPTKDYHDFKKLTPNKFATNLIQSLQKHRESITEMFSGARVQVKDVHEGPEEEESDSSDPATPNDIIFSTNLKLNARKVVKYYEKSRNEGPESQGRPSTSLSISKHGELAFTSYDDWLKPSETSIQSPKKSERMLIRGILNKMIKDSVQSQKEEKVRNSLDLNLLNGNNFTEHSKRIDEIFANSDDKMALILEFQRKFNRIDHNIRKDPEIQARLLELLAQLQTRILAIVDQKHNEAIAIENSYYQELIHNGDALDQRITHIFTYFIFHLKSETHSFRSFLNESNQELLGASGLDGDLFEFRALDLLNPEKNQIRGRFEIEKKEEGPEITLQDFLEGRVTLEAGSRSQMGPGSLEDAKPASMMAFKMDPTLYFVEKVLSRVLDQDTKLAVMERVLKLSSGSNNRSTREELTSLIALLSDHASETCKLAKENHKKVEEYVFEAIESLKKLSYRNRNKSDILLVLQSIRKDVRVRGRQLHSKLGEIEERVLNQLILVQTGLLEEFDAIERKNASLYKKEIECSGLLTEIFKIAIQNRTSVKADINLGSDSFSIEFWDHQKVRVESTPNEIQVKVYDVNEKDLPSSE